MLPPEKAHSLTVFTWRCVVRMPVVGQIIRRIFGSHSEAKAVRLFGLDFKNPVGLAAGFDKDGKYFKDMAALGFGFIEIGTVTPKPQAGNPRPRLFRLPNDRALINRMGFNNEGVDALVERLKKGKPEGLIIGGNIGKNKNTPNEQAAEDYAICFKKLFPYVDYFVVNVSSPNTPGLRELQEREPLTKLLQHLQQLNHKNEFPKPILLKIAPDLSDEQLDDILLIARETALAGIIATNTTIERSGLNTPEKRLASIGAGGLSGAPLLRRSTEIIRYLHQKTAGKLTIIAVGGIDSAAAAKEKMDAGASLVQVYTGLIYEGPALVKRICRAIQRQ